ncbi:guanylate kinase [Planctomycetota bacterium]
MNKQIVVISGPSGVGKTTLCDELLKREPRLEACITATTRQPRPNETNGQDYYFVSQLQFRHWIKKGQLIEYTYIFGNYYGTPKQSVNQICRKNKYPLLRIDVQGAQKLRKLKYQGLFIFIRPPNLKTLTGRLKKRAKKDGSSTLVLRKRLQRVDQELKMSRYYDFQIINDQLNRAVKEIRNTLRQYLFHKVCN